MSDKTILTTGGLDPNAGLTPSKHLAVVIRGQQDLQNKHLRPGQLGIVVDGLHRSALNIQDQFSRMPAITDDTIYARAGALLKSVKEILKQSDLERKAMTAPILQLKKDVDAVFEHGADNALHQVKVNIEQQMLKFATDKRAKQRAEEEARAAEAKKVAEELARQAEEGGNAGAAEMLREMAAEQDQQQAADVVESHGVKTQLRTRKHVNVVKPRVALAYIAHHATDEEIGGIISFNSRALTAFITKRLGGELEPGEPPGTGVEITETDSITNF